MTAYQLLTGGRLPWHGDADWLAAAARNGSGQHTSSILGAVPSSNKDLWRAILYGTLDFEWPPWDQLSGELALHVLRPHSLPQSL